MTKHLPNHKMEHNGDLCFGSEKTTQLMLPIHSGWKLVNKCLIIFFNIASEAILKVQFLSKKVYFEKYNLIFLKIQLTLICKK